MEELVDPAPDASQKIFGEEPSGGSQWTSEAEAPSDTLAAERDRAVAEKEEIWDRFLRKQAEFDNFRKRVLREKEEVSQFAVMQVIRGLLPVLDDFERALQAPSGGDEYRRGIELIYKRLYDTLVQAGLSPIDTQGKQFDPHYHQAVDTVKVDDLPDQSIVEQYQRGYEFKGRLLRPAMVKVAVRE